MPDALMAGVLRANQRKTMSDADRDIFETLARLSENFEPILVDVNSQHAPNHLETPRRGGFVLLANAVAADLAGTLPTGIANRDFTVADPNSANFVWNIIGNTGINQKTATLFETDGSMLTDLSQTFVMPSGIKQLKFTLSGIQLDVSNAGEPGDVLEVALLNANTTESRLGPMAGLAGSDGLLSIQSDGRVYVSPGVSVQGTVTSGQLFDLTKPIQVTVDLRSVPVGSINTLYFDLIGLGNSDNSQVKLNDLGLFIAISWHNLDKPMDVDIDGIISPLDALTMINEINAPTILPPGSSLLPAITETVSPPPYYDVNNDGFLDALDVIIVINYLNREWGGVGTNSKWTWQNHPIRLDVNNNGSIDLLDALTAINEFNSPIYSQNGRLPPLSAPPPWYFDVDGDNYITPLDILEIVNELNKTGEGEYSDQEGLESAINGIALDLVNSGSV
jgi:hypothetical protein